MKTYTGNKTTKVASLEALDILPHGTDDPCELGARHIGQWRLHLISALRNQKVDETDPCRADLNQQVVGADFRGRHFGVAERLWRPERVDSDGFHLTPPPMNGRRIGVQGRSRYRFMCS